MAAAASSSCASSSPSSEGATPRCRGQHHFLPDDMWLAILSFLRAPQWALVGGTCRRLRFVATRHPLWAPLLAAQFPALQAPVGADGACRVYSARRRQLAALVAGLGLHRARRPDITPEASAMCFDLHDGPAKVLVFGCQGAGKKCLMAALTTREDQPLPEDLPGPEGELPDVEPPPPSLLQLYSQDVYDSDGLRVQLQFAFVNFCAVVWVVDSADVAHIQQARREMEKVMAMPEFAAAVLLVLANKQDLPTAHPVAALATELALPPRLAQGRCAIFPVSGVTGVGLADAFEWLTLRLAEDIWAHHNPESECPPSPPPL
eukprot:EG_transcript_20518